MALAQKNEDARSLRNVKIVLIDDHPLLTSGLARMLLHRGCDVVWEFAECQDFVDFFARHQPDVIVTDIVMPGTDIIDALQNLRKTGFAFKLIFLSGYFSDTNLMRAMQAKADGLVSKSDGPNEVVHALERVLEGEKFISESLQGKLELNSCAKNVVQTGFSGLTGREFEVLKLLAEGHSIKEISKKLAIAVKTVDRHRTNIMNKLNVHSQVDLVRLAIREQIVVP
jgi:DNA-binding NarL/FixJ family response regulator